MTASHPPYATPASPSGGTGSGLWGMIALLIALVALAAAAFSVLVDGDYGSTTARLVGMASALGQLAPFLALLAVLVEPARLRGWAYTALVVCAVAAALNGWSSGRGAATPQTAQPTAVPSTSAPTPSPAPAPR